MDDAKKPEIKYIEMTFKVPSMKVGGFNLPILGFGRYDDLSVEQKIERAKKRLENYREDMAKGIKRIVPY